MSFYEIVLSQISLFGRIIKDDLSNLANQTEKNFDILDGADSKAIGSGGGSDRNIKNLLTFANLSKCQKLELTKFKNSILIKSKKSILNLSKKSDLTKFIIFPNANTFETDYFTPNAKITFINLEKSSIKAPII